VVGGVNNFGTVFKLNNSGSYFAVLHTFLGGTDGAQPYSTLTMDGQGNLFGTTLTGGASNYGTVFKVDPYGHSSVLYNFKGGTDGSLPFGSLIVDAGDSLYGTTLRGGSGSDGTVYKISANGTETLLQNLKGSTDGGFPYAGLAMDGSYNLYGTTQYGGNNTLNSNFGGGVTGEGVIFTITNPYNALISLVEQKVNNPFYVNFMVNSLQAAQSESIEGEAGDTDWQLNNFLNQLFWARLFGMVSSTDATTMTNKANALMM
jgi:uncharacterized repeat protein (TIGR03803 family)